MTETLVKRFSDEMLAYFGYKVKKDPESLTEQEIIMIVTCKYGIEFADLTTRKRFRDLVIPRQDMMYLLRINTKKTWGEIAKIFNRNHATAIHSIKQVELDCAFDSERREFLNQYLPDKRKLIKYNIC